MTQLVHVEHERGPRIRTDGDSSMSLLYSPATSFHGAADH